MIDIHNHILFGVDDGAGDIDQSLALLRDEISRGVDKIILTPHFKKSLKHKWENVLPNFNALKGAAEREGLKVRLYLGSEVFLGPDYYATLESREFYTLAGSDYILVEFSIYEDAGFISEICYETKLKGYMPVIAHVERFESLYAGKSILDELSQEGVLFQVDADVMVQDEDRRCRKHADMLLKRGLVSFIASDMHDLNMRGSHMDEAYGRVSKIAGRDCADRIFSINPRKVLNNEKIAPPEIQAAGKGKKNILSRIFGV